MSQIPTQYINLYCEKDTDFSTDLRILKTNRFHDDDLSNCVIEAIIRDSYLQDDPIYLTINNSEITTGLVTISLSREETTNLNCQNYSFDMYITTGDIRSKLFYGLFKVYP